MGKSCLSVNCSPNSYQCCEQAQTRRTCPVDGKNMGRAFREGVSPGRRVVTNERDQRFESAIVEGRLSHLWNRATRNNRTKQEKIEVEALSRVIREANAQGNYFFGI